MEEEVAWPLPKESEGGERSRCSIVRTWDRQICGRPTDVSDGFVQPLAFGVSFKAHASQVDRTFRPLYFQNYNAARAEYVLRVKQINVARVDIT